MNQELVPTGLYKQFREVEEMGRQKGRDERQFFQMFLGSIYLWMLQVFVARAIDLIDLMRSI